MIGGAPRNLESAKKVLTRLDLQQLCGDLAPSNRSFQDDGWSCGFWCLERTEQAMRANRGEPPFVYLSHKELMKRVNEFIKKCKPAPPKKAQEPAVLEEKKKIRKQIEP